MQNKSVATTVDNVANSIRSGRLNPAAPHLNRSAKMILYQPIKDRAPFFTGWETESAAFDTRCPHCKTSLQVKFKEMLDAAWGWQDRMDEQLREPLAKIFEINLSNRSIATGMPGVVARTCPNCHKASFFYFHFNETSNSVYSISLRAAATEDPNQAQSGPQE